jgi:hypothetical protein
VLVEADEFGAAEGTQNGDDALITDDGPDDDGPGDGARGDGVGDDE